MLAILTRFFPVTVLLLGCLAVPAAQGWDHLAGDTIRTQTGDPAVRAALPGYGNVRVRMAAGSVWFYYDGPDPADSLAALEIQLTFRDGTPLEPMPAGGVPMPSIFGPLAGFIGDEAMGYDASRDHPPGNGCWIRARVGTRYLFVRDSGVPFTQLTALARSLAAALPWLPEPNSFEIEESEKEHSNPVYMELDSKEFARIAPGLLQDPPDFSLFDLKPSNVLYPDLGFGYRLEGGYGGIGGYLLMYATATFKDGVVEFFGNTVAFPGAPADPEFYQTLFRPLFGEHPRKAGDIGSRYWHYARAAEPLAAGYFPTSMPKVSIPDDHPDKALIDWLMTPFSGTTYVADRTTWKDLSRLDANTCLYLLRSKNPATRLRAIGNLRRHAAEWGVDLPALSASFEAVYQNLPKVMTVHGCSGEEEGARAVVNESVAGD